MTLSRSNSLVPADHAAKKSRLALSGAGEGIVTLVLMGMSTLSPITKASPGLSTGSISITRRRWTASTIGKSSSSRLLRLRRIQSALLR